MNHDKFPGIEKSRHQAGKGKSDPKSIKIAKKKTGNAGGSGDIGGGVGKGKGKSVGQKKGFGGSYE